MNTTHFKKGLIDPNDFPIEPFAMGKRNWCCAIGFHQYEVYKEIDIKDPRGIPVVKVLVLRCKDCGRIRSERIVINDTHYYSN